MKSDKIRGQGAFAKAWLASNGSVLELSRDLARFLH